MSISMTQVNLMPFGAFAIGLIAEAVGALWAPGGMVALPGFATSSRSRAAGGASSARPSAGSNSDDSPRWVNLGRACEILGVNESTVRRWADSGEIRCFRTPGGHRRFAEEDLFNLIRGERDHALETAAVRRIRRRLHSGSKDAGWYGSLDADDREALRPLGRRLVELVGDYITRRSPRAEIEAEVDAIGHSYGDLLVHRETPLLRAMEAFTFFRRSLDETAKQLAERDQMDAEQAALAREQIAGLADRVLLGVTAAYDDR